MYKILATTPEEKLIQKSWGHRWGAFGKIEGRGNRVLILLGVRYGKIAYCSDAPHGLSDEYVGFVKFQDRSMLIVTAHEVTRKDLLKNCWSYMPEHDSVISKMILSGMQVYYA